MILQRRLVGLRIRLADAELSTKYTFPFIRPDWTTAFVVVDVLGRGPRVLPAPLGRDSQGIVSKTPVEGLTRIDTIPIEDFERLVHFDPWWDFRGVGGVGREWIEAVLASNIAKPFSFRGRVHKVHDLELDDSLGTLEAIVAEDNRFHRVSLRGGDVDLKSLRPAARRVSA